MYGYNDFMVLERAQKGKKKKKNEYKRIKYHALLKWVILDQMNLTPSPSGMRRSRETWWEV
jgi:hypothetical protein